ncbi:hypothetical protein GR7B_00042 [Vibrio phage vB_VcorM_GR7B]|nr:hypothetical protein GR7B_00042 [Vibrio phage vB_VcorM_GR7B]
MKTAAKLLASLTGEYPQREDKVDLAAQVAEEANKRNGEEATIFLVGVDASTVEGISEKDAMGYVALYLEDKDKPQDDWEFLGYSKLLDPNGNPLLNPGDVQSIKGCNFQRQPDVHENTVYSVGIHESRSTYVGDGGNDAPQVIEKPVRGLTGVLKIKESDDE